MADAKADAVGGLAIPGIEILMSGWLHKQGQFVPSWKRRFFVLYTDRILSYFTDNTMSQYKGSINCTECDVETGEGLEGARDIEALPWLSLVGKQRKLLLRAESGETLDKWRSALTDEGGAGSLNMRRWRAAKKGWLTKLGAKSQKWQRRWFVHADGMLAYYYDDTEKDRRGFFLLQRLAVQMIDDTPRRFLLQNTSEARSMFVEADSEVEAQSWFELLNGYATAHEEGRHQNTASRSQTDIESTRTKVAEATALQRELAAQIEERREKERSSLQLEEAEVLGVKRALAQADRMKKIQAARAAESAEIQKLRAEGVFTSVARSAMRDFIQRLQGGMTVKKFSVKNGTPSDRFIWLDTVGSEKLWCESTKMARKGKHVVLKEISSVQQGSQNFAKTPKVSMLDSNWQWEDLSCCSIHSGLISLDIMLAKSEETAALLHFILDAIKRHRSY